MLKSLLVSVVVSSGCGLEGFDPSRSSVDPRPVGPAHLAQSAIKGFSTIVSRLTPVAERTCRRRAPQMNCQFVILLDTRPNLPFNAFQTLGKDGQPVIIFTLAMLATAQNDDELAFVLGHESTHHIQGHLQKKRQNALTGALIAANAGYDPLRGVAVFTRIADPGDAFLGTHPPKRRRIKIVQEAAALL